MHTVEGFLNSYHYLSFSSPPSDACPFDHPQLFAGSLLSGKYMSEFTLHYSVFALLDRLVLQMVAFKKNKCIIKSPEGGTFILTILGVFLLYCLCRPPSSMAPCRVSAWPLLPFIIPISTSYLHINVPCLLITWEITGLCGCLR